jgi:hypothetical protein
MHTPSWHAGNSVLDEIDVAVFALTTVVIVQLIILAVVVYVMKKVRNGRKAALDLVDKIYKDEDKLVMNEVHVDAAPTTKTRMTVSASSV